MDNQNLAIRIKDLRNRKGFSQEQLSEESKLSIRTIQRIEKGASIPRGDTLVKLSNALGVTPDAILDWTKIEDKGYLTLLNLSALASVFFQPLLGIIIPLTMWILKKDKINLVDDYGKRLISFQITWTLAFYTLFIILSKGRYIPFNFNIFSLLPQLLTFKINGEFIYSVILQIFYLYNIVLIFINLKRVKKGLKSNYFPAIPFLK
jgi:transcriptional regulator with XRE-family HTH domain